MERRHAIALGLGGLGVSSLSAAFLMGESDDEKIRALLNQLARAVSFDDTPGNPILFASRLAETFSALLSEPVEISVPEASPELPTDPSQLALLGAEFLSRFASFRVSFEDVDIDVDPVPSAKCRVKTLVSGSSGLESGERPVELSFLGDGTDYRLKSLRVRPSEP